MKKDIENIFKKYNNIVEMKTLNKSGVTYYRLNELIDQEKVIKIKQGVYKWNDSDYENHQNELIDVSLLVKQGVFCLFTAASYYELTTFVSSEYHIVIPKKSKIVLPEYPPIKLYYWEDMAYRLGTADVPVDQSIVKMYDIEKTVCDMLRFKNKVGLDIAKEVLKNYLNRSDRNISKLNMYAQRLNIGKLMNNYLEILL